MFIKTGDEQPILKVLSEEKIKEEMEKLKKQAEELAKDKDKK